MKESSSGNIMTLCGRTATVDSMCEGEVLGCQPVYLGIPGTQLYSLVLLAPLSEDQG